MKLLTVLSLALLASVASAQNLLVIGGIDDTFLPYGSIEVVTPTGTCTGKIPDMPFEGNGMSAAVLANGDLHVCGGLVSLTAVSECYQYSFAVDAWTEVEPLAGNTAYPAYAGVGGMHIMAGGEDEAGLYLGTTTSYDGTSFTPLADYPDLRSQGCGVAMSETEFFVNGGTGANPKAANILNLDTNTWESIPEMFYARFNHGCMLFSTGECLSDYCRLCYEDVEDSWHLATACPALERERDSAFGELGPKDGGWKLSGLRDFTKRESVDEICQLRPTWNDDPFY